MASAAGTAKEDIVVATAAEFIPVTPAEHADSLVAELVDMRAAAEASGADRLAADSTAAAPVAASTAVVAVTAAADSADPGRTSFRNDKRLPDHSGSRFLCSSRDAREISG